PRAEACGKLRDYPLSMDSQMHPGRVTRKFSLLLPGFLLFMAAFSLPAWSQGSDENVHVAPRPKTQLQPQPDPKSPDKNDATAKVRNKTYRKDVDLVLVNVTVTDPMNRLVTGLEKDNFQLFEGTEAQQIKHFSSEDTPISLGVIFDISGSMKT